MVFGVLILFSKLRFSGRSKGGEAMRDGEPWSCFEYLNPEGVVRRKKLSVVWVRLF